MNYHNISSTLKILHTRIQQKNIFAYDIQIPDKKSRKRISRYFKSV